MSTERYWGKYRGTVVNNLDPEQRGRIQAIVPAVTGLILSTWAMPCVPFAGKLEGFFVVPQIGAAVWMEYEDGDPDKPIWVGGFWGLASEAPSGGDGSASHPAGPEHRGANDAAKLDRSQRLRAHARQRRRQLKSTTGASILVNDSGIYISNGKGAEITMIGPTITVNQEALVIT